MRLHQRFSIWCLIFWAPSLALSKQIPAPAAVATVIALDGQPEWQDGPGWKPVALGQIFGPGDHLRCGKESSLQCVIGQDLSVAVEPGTALDFPGPGDPAAQIHLGLGRVGVFAGQGQAVALRTDTALVLSGPAPCDLELSAFSQQSLLATSQCDARFSDPKQRKTVALAPYSSALLSQGRLMGPDTLGKRDLSDMNARWERARLFFGQRKELLGAMAAMPEHAAFVKALKKRLAADHAR